MSVQEIYEEAGKLSLEINAPCYNLILVSLQEKKNQENRRQESREFAGKQDELLRYLLRYPEHMVFRWNINTYGVLLKSEKVQMEELTSRCMENIRRICSDAPLEKRRVGLRNVYKRMKLLYGDRGGLTVEEASPGVIRARLVIPLESAAQAEKESGEVSEK